MFEAQKLPFSFKILQNLRKDVQTKIITKFKPLDNGYRYHVNIKIWALKIIHLKIC